MNDRDTARLALCDLFSNLPVERFAELAADLRWRDQWYRKGALILLQGCLYSSLYILVEGSAYAEMSDDEGRCMRVETFSPVESLASAVLFAPRPRLPVTVGAQSECHIFSLPKIDLIKISMRENSILEALLAENGTRIQFLSERLRLTRFATLRQRIADWLVRQAQSNLEGLPAQPLKVLKAHVEPSFEKMADLMGVERPSLSRELSHMRDDGLIEIEGRTIYLKNYEVLKRIRHGKHEKG